MVRVAFRGSLDAPPEKGSEPADQDSITRAEKREAEFMQRQADYVAEHGHSKHYSLKDGKVYE